jgi:hypothetical protein
VPAGERPAVLGTTSRSHVRGACPPLATWIPTGTPVLLSAMAAQKIFFISSKKFVVRGL